MSNRGSEQRSERRAEQRAGKTTTGAETEFPSPTAGEVAGLFIRSWDKRPSWPPPERPEDNEALLYGIEPEVLERHLEEAEAPWKRLGYNPAPGKAAIWEVEVPAGLEGAPARPRSGTYVVMVALGTRYRDYPLRMREALSTISLIEGRTVPELMTALYSLRSAMAGEREGGSGS